MNFNLQSKKTLTAPASFITGHSPMLEDGQKDMWVELVDVLMIDVGCTDVTWSHAWNSVWVSSYRHFLVVCGWLVNITRGSRGFWSSWQTSQCTLFSALVYYWTCGSSSTVLAPGYPQVPPYWSHSPGSPLYSSTKCTVQECSSRRHPHLLVCPQYHECLAAFLLCSWWSDFHMESLFQNFTVLSEIRNSACLTRESHPVCQEL